MPRRRFHAPRESGALSREKTPPACRSAFDIVVIAASLGGPQVLAELLLELRTDLSVPVLITQHLAPLSRLAETFRTITGLPVSWAGDDTRLRPGGIYMAPPERHLVVLDRGRAGARAGPRINYACPAADLLFESAAAHYGRKTLGLVLSGALFDGAAGARAIRSAGGTVLVQDPQSCRAPSMPLEAIKRTNSRLVLPPRSLAHAIIALVTIPGADALLGCGASVA